MKSGFTDLSSFVSEGVTVGSPSASVGVAVGVGVFGRGVGEAAIQTLFPSTPPKIIVIVEYLYIPDD